MLLSPHDGRSHRGSAFYAHLCCSRVPCPPGLSGACDKLRAQCPTPSRRPVTDPSDAPAPAAGTVIELTGAGSPGQPQGPTANTTPAPTEANTATSTLHVFRDVGRKL